MIYAIVTAAGRSRRMGVQKLLLPFGPTTVIGRVVDRLLASDVASVRVVVGSKDGPVAREMARRPVSLVLNPDPDSDMLASARCALETLPPECEAVLLALGDQPAIQTKWVNDLIGAYDGSEKSIAVPTYAGKRGHPVLFSARYRNEILTQFDGKGLRGLIEAHPDEILEFPISNPDVLADIDYPEDYRRALERLPRNNRDSFEEKPRA